MKRVFDTFAAAIGLLTLAPCLAFIAAIIWATSGRPVLFRQMRVGRNGNDFVLLKFRTMTVRAGTEKGSFDAGSAQRVTPIGRFLRKTKLDEFPQLWNVLKGDMALVGPRPEVQKWVEVYPERWKKVLAVRPGITDPASVQYRNEEEVLAASSDPERTYRQEILPRKLDLYEHYVRTRTFAGDIGVILKTLCVVFKG